MLGAIKNIIGATPPMSLGPMGGTHVLCYNQSAQLRTMTNSPNIFSSINVTYFYYNKKYYSEIVKA